MGLSRDLSHAPCFKQNGCRLQSGRGSAAIKLSWQAASPIGRYVSRNKLCWFSNLLLFTAEFVAHGSDVTCAALSPSSGRTLVTGGEDRRLNVWIVGQPQCVVRVCVNRAEFSEHFNFFETNPLLLLLGAHVGAITSDRTAQF